MIHSTDGFIRTLLAVFWIMSACEHQDPEAPIKVSTSTTPYFVADAGDDLSIQTGDMVNLKASFARNQFNNTFNWRFLSKPENSQAELLNPGIPNTSFIADQQGIYKLELSMSQDKYAVYDTVNVSVFTIVEQAGSYSIPSVGANGEIIKFMVFQDRLYAIGDFTRIGGVTAHGFASFDGSQWSSAGLFEGRISDLMVFQNELYVTGIFQEIGSIDALNIARWNGENWKVLGDIEYAYVLAAMSVFQGELYVGGDIKGQYLLKWDGSHFINVPIPRGNYVSELVVFQNALYIRASIDVCISTAFENWWDCEFTPFYLQYDGIQWEEVMVENGLTSISTSFDNYQYEAYFPFAGNSDGSYMAGRQNKLYFKSGYWENNHFQEFAYPIEKVFTMQTFDEELYVGGLYQKAGARNNGILKWDGQRWSTLGDGIDGRVMAIERFQGKLYMGGKFDRAGGQPAANIIIWNEN